MLVEKRVRPDEENCQWKELKQKYYSLCWMQKENLNRPTGIKNCYAIWNAYMIYAKKLKFKHAHEFHKIHYAVKYMSYILNFNGNQLI